jgi:LysR family transcriptional activator of nhaA
VVFRYANEIFNTGRELIETLKGRRTDGRAVPLTVGVANAVPKLLVYRFLEPLLQGSPPIQLECREEGLDRLLGDLVTHTIDMVIADAPAPTQIRVKAFNHLLVSPARRSLPRLPWRARFADVFPTR